MYVLHRGTGILRHGGFANCRVWTGEKGSVLRDGGGDEEGQDAALRRVLLITDVDVEDRAMVFADTCVVPR